MFSSIRTAVVTTTFMNTRGYGYCRINGTDDVRVKVDLLTAAGFGPSDYKEGAMITFEDEGKNGKVRVKRITAIGDRLALNFFTIRHGVDRNNGLVIDKVTEVGRERFPTFRIIAENGDFVSTELSLGVARDKIGKVIEAPVALNAGKKTNVGGLGHVKGDSNGKGQQQSGKAKKAA